MGLTNRQFQGFVRLTLAQIERALNESPDNKELQELKDIFTKVMADKTIGIVLLTEKFGREYPDLINDIKLNHRLPLIVEIPDRHGTGRKPNFITDYVNEAIGLKL